MICHITITWYYDYQTWCAIQMLCFWYNFYIRSTVTKISKNLNRNSLWCILYRVSIIFFDDSKKIIWTQVPKSFIPKIHDGELIKMLVFHKCLIDPLPNCIVIWRSSLWYGEAHLASQLGWVNFIQWRHKRPLNR